jgi:hypothetical protein
MCAENKIMHWPDKIPIITNLETENQLIIDYLGAKHKENLFVKWGRNIQLIKQHLPKGTALNKVTTEDIADIQVTPNNRLRKLVSYKTPNEVYDAARLIA